MDEDGERNCDNSPISILYCAAGWEKTVVDVEQEEEQNEVKAEGEKSERACHQDEVMVTVR